MESRQKVIRTVVLSVGVGRANIKSENLSSNFLRLIYIYIKIPSTIIEPCILSITYAKANVSLYSELSKCNM